MNPENNASPQPVLSRPAPIPAPLPAPLAAPPIETVEQMPVRLDVRPAEFTTRLISFLIDTVVLLMVTTPLAVLFAFKVLAKFAPQAIGGYSSSSRRSGLSEEMWVLIVLLSVLWLNAILEICFNASLGKACSFLMIFTHWGVVPPYGRRVLRCLLARLPLVWLTLSIWAEFLFPDVMWKYRNGPLIPMGVLILLCGQLLSGLFVLFPGRLSLHDRITGTAVYDLSSVRALVGDRGRFGWAFRTGAFEVMPVGSAPNKPTEG